jgi:hypothetical protein
MKSITYTFALLLAAFLTTSACQSGGDNQTTAPAPPSQPPAAADASAAAGDRLRTFVPPPDGRLTTAQVEQYIAVRRRALQMVKEVKPAASLVSILAEIPQAETRAAGELGRDIAEYRWVQARISEASSPTLPEGPGADVLKAIEASATKRSAELQKAAADDRRVPAPVAADAAAVAFNRSVLDPFRTELAALEKS